MVLLEETCSALDEMLRTEEASDVAFALNQASQDVRRALMTLKLLHEERHTSEEHFYVEWG
jgi:hypothetical protein